ncbi:MAG TPA: hypothetical protein VGE70_05870 [Burkholderiaceae bacterium]
MSRSLDGEGVRPGRLARGRAGHAAIGMGHSATLPQEPGGGISSMAHNVARP